MTQTHIPVLGSHTTCMMNVIIFLHAINSESTFLIFNQEQWLFTDIVWERQTCHHIRSHSNILAGGNMASKTNVHHLSDKNLLYTCNMVINVHCGLLDDCSLYVMKLSPTARYSGIWNNMSIIFHVVMHVWHYTILYNIPCGYTGTCTLLKMDQETSTANEGNLMRNNL
jgi:hypothetical protein